MFARGSVVGAYVIIDYLKATRWCDTYRAYEPSLDRIVALTALTEDGVREPEVSAAFGAFLRMWASVQHPNVVSLQGAGEQEGRPYGVTELPAGPTFDVWLRAEPQPAEAIRTKLTQLTSGVAALEGSGLPLPTPDLRAVCLRPSGEPVLPVEFTFGGVCPGPAEAQAILAALWEVTLVGHVVPREVTRALARAQASRQASRYPTVAAFARALEVPGPAGSRLRWTSFAGAVVAASVLAAYVMRTHPCDQAGAPVELVWSEERRRAVETALVSEGGLSARGAQEVLQQLSDWRSAWREARVAVCRRARREAVGDPQLSCLDGALAELQTVTGLLSGPAAGRAGELLAALSSPTRCSSIAEGSPAPVSPSVARVERELARLRLELLAHADLEGMRRRLDALREPIERLGRPDALEARWLQRMAYVAIEDGDLNRAERLLDEGAERAVRAGDDRLAVLLLGKLAFVQATRDQSGAAAEETFALVAPLLARVSGREQAELTIHVDHSRATVLDLTGRAQEAVTLWRSIAERAERLFGSDSSQTISVYGNLLLSLVGANRDDEADALYARLVPALRERSPRHPLTVGMTLNWALLRSRMGEHLRALELAQQALAVATSSASGARSLEIARATVAFVALAAGDTGLARRVAAAAVDARQGQAPGYLTLSAALVLAEADLQDGQVGSGRQRLAEILSMVRASMPGATELRAEALALAAILELRAGRAARARVHLEELEGLRPPPGDPVPVALVDMTRALGLRRVDAAEASRLKDRGWPVLERSRPDLARWLSEMFPTFADQPATLGFVAP